MASQYWGPTPNSPGTQTLYNSDGSSSGFSPETNTTPSTGYPNGQGLVNPVSGLAMGGPYGGASSMTSGGIGWGANGQPRVNVGGYWYLANSPEAVAAQRLNQQVGATSAGQAAGDYTQGAISQIPSLQGLLTGSSSLLSSAGASGGSTGGTSFGGGTGVGGGGVSGGATVGGGYGAPIQVPDQSAAIAGKFAAAKDTVGQTARSALDSLRGELGATGQLGGGAEATGVQNVINAGQAQLGDVSRGEAASQAQLGTDVAEKNAELGVTERGQDVQAQEAQARLALENRQQLFGMLGLAMQGLAGGGKGAGASAPSFQLY